ncbi:MAG: RNA methyltransferase TrmH family [Chloroflexi bacterium]|nr:MAG: RNA methyltransferase TrmH family [Chloroflexota bacterium]MBA4376240.1 RNA methyltransferase [Anaerolinea sp.]
MSTSELEQIVSTKNQHVQQVRELLTKKSAREKTGQFIVEGVRLSEEALNSGIVPIKVFYSETLSPRGLELVQKASASGSSVLFVTSNVMDALSETETAQGLIMVVQNLPKQLPDNLDFIIVVDQLRDPGNLGTVLRTAVAASAQAVLITPGSVDPYSPKVVRAAMGAHFSVPIISSSWAKILSLCKNRRLPLRIMLAESERGTPLWQVDLKQPIAIVIGGEAEGVSEEVRADADTLINIPMPGGSESLNAAVAASIILFEVVRQRSS